MYRDIIKFEPSDEMRDKIGKMTMTEVFEEFKTIIGFIGKDAALLWLVYDSLDYIKALEHASSVAPTTKSDLWGAMGTPREPTTRKPWEAA